MKPLQINLTGEVGGPGFNRAQLRGIPPARPLRLFIDSLGGHGPTSLAMFQQLRAHRAEVVAEIRVAGSAAATVALAAHRRAIRANGWMLVHSVWGAVAGFPDEMAEAAAHFATAEQHLVLCYSERTGLAPDVVKRLMRSERAFRAPEAVRLGFCHETLPAQGSIEPAPSREGMSPGDCQVARLEHVVQSLGFPAVQAERPAAERERGVFATMQEIFRRRAAQARARRQPEPPCTQINAISHKCTTCGERHYTSPTSACPLVTPTE